MSRILISSSRKFLGKFLIGKLNFHNTFNHANINQIRDRIVWGSMETTDMNFSQDKNISVQSQSTIDMKVNEKPATIKYDTDLKTLLTEMSCNYFDEQYFTNCDCFGDSNLCSLYNLSAINYQTISDNYSYPGKSAMNIYLSVSKNFDESLEDENKKGLFTFPEKDLMQVNAAFPQENINYNDVIDSEDFFPVYKAKELKKNPDEEEAIVANSFQWDGNSYNKKWVYINDDPKHETQFEELNPINPEEHETFDAFSEDDLTLEESTLDETALEDVIYSDLAADSENTLAIITNPYAGNND